MAVSAATQTRRFGERHLLRAYRDWPVILGHSENASGGRRRTLLPVSREVFTDLSAWRKKR
jgi:hypothetical protein